MSIRLLVDSIYCGMSGESIDKHAHVASAGQTRHRHVGKIYADLSQWFMRSLADVNSRRHRRCMLLRIQACPTCTTHRNLVEALRIRHRCIDTFWVIMTTSPMP